jgi:hypothetical protein
MSRGLLLARMVWIEIRSALGVLLRVLRLMRKVKQSAWRRQGRARASCAGWSDDRCRGFTWAADENLEGNAQTSWTPLACFT